MERILRSCLQIGGVPEADQALTNWYKLLEHDLEFPIEEDRKIYEYLKTFFNQMSSPPDFSLIKEFFEKKDEIETVSRLDELKKAQFYTHTNFLSIVRNEREQQSIKSVILACRDASHIAEHGRHLEKPIDGKKILRGPQDAIGFLFDRMSQLTAVESGEKLEGDITMDADDVLEEYNKVAGANKFANRNLFGLEPVDSVCRGHKAGEYWIHTAFTSELKTTLALNYLYNNTFLYEKNIFYAILEMPYTQLRRQLYVLHSSHGKFVTDWYSEDKRRGIPEAERYTGLNYRKVRDGELDEIDYKRLVKVAQDFKATRKGVPYIWRPEQGMPSIKDIKRKAEMFHNKYGCDGIVIDHLGLVRPQHRTNDQVTMVNSVIQEGRMLALNFARGKTVPVLGLFQLNRQGKMRADKADGKYDIAAIAYANEVEKSADVITYTYLNDELRRQGKFYLGCLKNRDNMLFERMVGKIIWHSKRMRAIESGLIDFDTDHLKAAVKAVTLTADDLI